MISTGRQRLKKFPLPRQTILNLLIISSITLLLPVFSSLTEAAQFATINPSTPNKQYAGQPKATQNNALPSASGLVSQQAPLSAQEQISLLGPIKPAPQQQDLDNVIESTTAGFSSLLATQQAKQQPTAATNARCQLPPTWAGRWFQSNKEPIRVTNTEISDKGICRDQKGDKYLFEFTGNNKQEPCYYCLVINERHLNVLQYKESNCQPAPAAISNQSINNLMNGDLDYNDHSLLDSICSEINGDATLESLFRLDAPAIECPINGQYSFTYDGCKETQSALDSCIDKKQLNFKFSACQDVPGSESKSEVLKCYADWSEGNNYYMIGRLEYASNHQDKGKFRCFLYDKSSDGKFILMSQTLEENCYGLLAPNEGPKTLRLTARAPTVNKCNFPSYIQGLSENWLSVDNSLIYMFNQNSTKYQVKETKEGNIIEEAACLQQFTHPLPFSVNLQHPHSLHHQQQHTRSNQHQQQVLSQNRRYQSTTSNYPQQADQSSFHSQISSSRSTINDVVYLVQITKNCQTMQYCVRFYKRSNGIVQIDYYLSSPNGDNQCRVVGSPQTQIITSTTLENQKCPFEGAYTIDAPIESDLTYNPSNIFICPRQSFITAQCDHPSRLRIHSRCAPNRALVKNLYCLGSWTAGGLVRLLLADDDRQRYSAWYRDHDSQQIQQNQDGEGQQPHVQALQSQQQQTSMTRSQHLLSSAASSPQAHIGPILPIIDLNIALITPIPIPIKTMQVRLTRRNQCSDLKLYSGSGSYGSAGLGGSPSASSSSSMLSYSPPSSSSNASLHHQSSYFLMILIVTTIFFNFIYQGPQIDRTMTNSR